VDVADVADVALHVQRLFKEMSSAFGKSKRNQYPLMPTWLTWLRQDDDEKTEFLNNVSRTKAIALEETSSVDLVAADNGNKIPSGLPAAL
jgi:hypothetical protein